MRTLLTTLALAVSLVPGVPATSTSDTPGSVDSLSWGPCPQPAPGLECTTLDVPLDYRDKDGRTIEIAISRLRSTNPQQRRGVLLTNTGGPGGEGLTFPAIMRDNLGVPKEVLDRYDVIGMDPRGVGQSTPVTCELTQAEHPTNIPLYAVSPADVAAEATRVEAVAEKCGASPTASLLPHITTANTARDMDRVRAALGERKVSYFGISYGTYLGSVYATLFPDRGDRIMLDSATGPGGWDASFTRLFGRGVEERFPDFVPYAAAQGLGETLEQVRAKYFDLAARLDATPSPEGYTGQVFRHITFAAFYYDRSLPGLARTWQALDTGQPVPPGAAAGVPADNYLASQLHVICNDSDWPESVGIYQRNVAVDRVRYPMFGAAAANITPCAFWPSEPVERPVRITGRGPSNVLILQNRRDPATPLAGALALRKAFGDRARIVTADQGGHLAYLYLDNDCLNTIATEFLATGTRPRHDTACPA
jgi:pimeloyl-ACP methyl ester carboxylesterase